MNTSERTGVEYCAAAAVVAIGLFFTALALGINPNSFDPIGPRLFPLCLAVILVCGGLLLAVANRVSKARLPTNQQANKDSGIQETYGFADANVGRIMLVLLAGVIYLVLFAVAGYFAATVIAAAFILFAFGNRNLIALTVLPVIAALLYQFVFIGLMNLNDPKGLLIDLRPYTNWISGA